MIQQFTERARKVMALANQQAQRLNHEYIGTEHILLGLVEEGSGVAANVLKQMGVDYPKVELEVDELVKRGPDVVSAGALPSTPGAKKVIEHAIEEARALGHNYVGTEHLLLGLLREPEAVAARVLVDLGIKLEQVRKGVLNILGAEGAEVEKEEAQNAVPSSPAPTDPELAEVVRSWSGLNVALRKAILAIVRSGRAEGGRAGA